MIHIFIAILFTSFSATASANRYNELKKIFTEANETIEVSEIPDLENVDSVQCLRLSGSSADWQEVFVVRLEKEFDGGPLFGNERVEFIAGPMTDIAAADWHLDTVVKDSTRTSLSYFFNSYDLDHEEWSNHVFTTYKKYRGFIVFQQRNEISDNNHGHTEMLYGYCFPKDEEGL